MATKWGIVSTGKISNDFVLAAKTWPSDEHQFVAVAARNLQSAKEFAAHHKIPKAYGSYEELAKDKDVEVVYIGVIHPFHLQVGKLMLNAGKPILVEKPLTLNLKCTKELISLAKSKKLFLMEALWSRYLPSFEFIMETIRNGVIGDVRHVSAHFCVKIAGVDRLSKKELGGGTIMDIGIYVINLIEMVYNGEMPEKICAVGHLNENKVDENVCASMLFSDGKTATFTIHSKIEFGETFIIGTKGFIKIPFPFWCADKVYLNDVLYEFPFPQTSEPCNFWNSAGLRYEAREVRNCLKEGKLESDRMTHNDSILLSTITDTIRKQIGVQYDADS